MSDFYTRDCFITISGLLTSSSLLVFALSFLSSNPTSAADGRLIAVCLLVIELVYIACFIRAHLQQERARQNALARHARKTWML